MWYSDRSGKLIFLAGSLPNSSGILLAGVHASIRSIRLSPLVMVPQALPTISCIGKFYYKIQIYTYYMCELNQFSLHLPF